MHSFDFPFRVASDRAALFDLLGADGTAVRASYHGDPAARPAVGDDVALDARGAVITAIAPRRSWIARAKDGGAQIVAANVTTGFVVTSPEPREFSPRRVARYLIALRAGGVEPVVLLNKCDAAADPGELVARLRAVAAGAAVVPLSALDGANCEALDAYLQPGATVALCGSSGVGKSTLLNRLCGGDAMATHAMRDDGRGRHTTAFRQLVMLANGAAIVDTPGMRSFVPWGTAADVDEAFSEIAALAGGCRFGDCRHEGEPGCAVRDGAPPERLEQWRKLQRELAWERTRTDAVAARERKERWKRIHKAARRNAGS